MYGRMLFQRTESKALLKLADNLFVYMSFFSCFHLGLNSQKVLDEEFSLHR